MLLPGLLFHAVGNITSLLFSVSFIGSQYHVGFSTRSHLCHCSLSEGGAVYLSELLHKKKTSRQFCSSSDSFTLRVPTTNRKTFGERSFSFTGHTV